MMKTILHNLVDRVLAAVMGVISFVIYLATLSAGAFPGSSAELVVQYTGAMPVRTASRPVWVALVWVFQRLPLGGDAVFRINLLSAVCGALAVSMLCRLLIGTVRLVIDTDVVDEGDARWAATLAGITGSLALTFCAPFWIVSTRAHFLALDVLLLVVAAQLMLLYARQGASRLLPILAFFYAVGTAQSATFIVFGPLYVGVLFLLMWRRGQLRPSPILAMVAAMLAGLCLYLVAALIYRGSDGYAVYEYRGVWDVAWSVLRQQYYMLTRSLPKVGWLMILFIAALPWFVTLLVARRALNAERDWTYFILHVVMTGMVGMVLFNTRFAPWTMLRFSRLLVTPYLLTAASIGYLAAYWYLLPLSWNVDVDDQKKRALRRTIGPVLTVIIIVAVCITSLRNVNDSDGRSARLMNNFAREVVAGLDGRTWVVTHGSMDNHLYLAADAADLELHLLNLRRSADPDYLRYIGSLLPTPREKNLVRLGVMPLLREWLSNDTSVTDRLAMFSTPDLWIATGFTVVPQKLVFLGVRDPATIDADALVALHREFWQRVVPDAEEASRPDGPLGGSELMIPRRVSMGANNLGVLLEDLGRPDDAFAAYGKALEVDDNNISALLNMSGMLRGGYQTARAEEIQSRLKEAAAAFKDHKMAWSLSRMYGYVRSPQAFARLGWTWALSGSQDMAVAGLRKALGLVPDEQRAGIQQVLAGVYLSQEKDEESESLYRELLEKDSKNVSALLGLARIAARQGRTEEAEALLVRAQDAGAAVEIVTVQRARARAASGDLPGARAILEALLDENPDVVMGWTTLADVLLRQNDRTALDSCLRRLERFKKGRLTAVAMRGHLAMMDGDWPAAAAHYRTVLIAQPSNPQLLERVLQTDLLTGKRDEAEEHALALLRLDAGNALANYAVGAIQLERGKHAMAEDSYRRSLATRETPEALNDLAWLLCIRLKYVEAEKFARRALAVNAKLHSAWDTLGVILMNNGRLDEAEDALARAMTLYPDDRNVHVHMAALQLRRGNKDRARDMLSAIAPESDMLSSHTRNQFDALREELGM